MGVVKLIHVGVGGWGGDWELNAIPPVKEVARTAIVDGHEPTLRKAQKALGLDDAMCFLTLEEAMAAVESDAVLVTAPAGAHVPLSIQAMEAGKHVLVEKPFSENPAEARAAVDTAEKLGKIIQVSQNYRFYPAPRAAQKLLAEGAIGEPSVIEIDFRKWANDAPKAGHRHYGIAHPLIFDMAIHHFDLIRKITGQEAKTVYARPLKPSWSKFEQEGAAAIIIEMESGLVVSYRGSWISAGEPTTWAGDWAIQGETGEIRFSSRVGGTVGAEGDRLTVRPRGKDAEPVKLETMDLWGRSAGLRAFANAVNGGPMAETFGKFNLGSVALMDAAARSSLSGVVEQVIQP
ncbi:MAG: Gfo/Idh/MocA family oxidoreductase [Thermomicrobiales bacterium]